MPSPIEVVDTQADRAKSPANKPPVNPGRRARGAFASVWIIGFSRWTLCLRRNPWQFPDRVQTEA